MQALQDLTIDGGSIIHIERDASPQWTNAKGDIIDGLPPRTIVKIALSPAPGSHSNVVIWLPDAENWNGRFLGRGNGGSAGTILTHTLIGPLKNGYAVATTDMGTAHTGVGNPEVWCDFGYRATHLMTVVGKQAVRAFYGKDAAYNYFFGASTGGQQALAEAQRYPEDYDGIIAGVPAHCRTPLHAYFLWNARILHRCPFTEEQEQGIIQAGLSTMAGQEVPVLAGKAISDSRCTPAEIEAVIALAMRQDPTLTHAHAEALQQLFDGPRHATTGERIFGGVPLGSGFTPATDHLYIFNWALGEDVDLMTVDYDEALDTYTAALAAHLNAEDPDLNAFEHRGGKIIMYSGMADSIVPYHATLDYYEHVAQHCGGLEQVQSFLKYYLIPGMGHGPGPVMHKLPDMLTLITDWRENGIVPDMLSGESLVDGQVDFTVPIYPYPTKIVWDPATGTYIPTVGPRGGVERVAERYRNS